MSFQVIMTPTAEKELKHLGKNEQKRIVRALSTMIDNPRPSGTRKLSGSQNDWRIRVGDYRILYEIDDT